VSKLGGGGGVVFCVGGIVNMFAQRLTIFITHTFGVVALGSLTNELKPR
jgi:hypothetical protein